LNIFIVPTTGKLLEKQSIKPLSNGNIIYVGGTGPGNYTRIQHAINDALEGYTVFVFDDSAPYNENLEINKSLNLIGEDKETTIINSIIKFKPGIYISNDWINISGFTVRNGNNGIRINSNNNTVTGNIIIENNWGGVTLKNSKFNKIIGNRIYDNIYGIQIYEKSCYNNISRNLIQKSFYAGIMIGNPIVPLHLNKKSNNFFNGIDGSNFNIIIKNTLINPTCNAYFHECQTNTWNQNYWGRPRILPKLISGYRGDFEGPWFNIDWNPAFLPYDKLF
jgi:parallel beta-helix repeat protein